MSDDEVSTSEGPAPFETEPPGAGDCDGLAGDGGARTWDPAGPGDAFDKSLPPPPLRPALVIEGGVTHFCTTGPGVDNRWS